MGDILKMRACLYIGASFNRESDCQQHVVYSRLGGPNKDCNRSLGKLLPWKRLQHLSLSQVCLF